MKPSFFQTTLSPQWRKHLLPLQQRWDAMASRERLGLSLAGASLGLLLLWQVAIAPAWRTVSEAPRQLELLDAQLQDMRRLAAQAHELRGVAGVSAAQAAQALGAATEHLGDAGKLSILGERATLTLSNASSEQLRAWLVEARNAARARPIEAQLQRGPKGYTGTLVLSLGST